MNITEIGEELCYFSKLWKYWSDKCTKGEITENQMENKLDKIESMSTYQMKNTWKRLIQKEQGE